MKIVQVGSFGQNLGDALALLSFRRKLGKHKWTDWNFRKRVDWTSINSHNAMIIGGGGLIEGGGWGLGTKIKTGWKLNLDVPVIKKIKVPIVVFAVGCNYWRDKAKLSPKGIKNLYALIDKAKLFSVRNDGSYEEIQQIYTGKKVIEVPDPGLISSKINPRKNDIINGVLGIATGSPGNMASRGITLDEIKQFVGDLRLSILPHTKQDMNAKFDYHSRIESYSDLSFFDHYNEFDYAVCMRGHSQLVCFAKNIPSISLATQNKVSDFCKKYELEDYCVDVQDKNWVGKLKECVYSLQNDKSYLNKWYEIRDKYHPQFVDRFNGFIDRVKQCFKIS